MPEMDSRSLFKVKCLPTKEIVRTLEVLKENLEMAGSAGALLNDLKDLNKKLDDALKHTENILTRISDDGKAEFLNEQKHIIAIAKMCLNITNSTVTGLDKFIIPVIRSVNEYCSKSINAY
jgi:hypothetical protein